MKILNQRRKNNILTLFTICAIAIFAGVLGSYSYFTAMTTDDNTLEFGNLELAFTDGTTELTDSTFQQKITATILPGDTLDLSNIYVKNKGDIDSYAILKLELDISGDNVSSYNITRWYNLEGENINIADLTTNTVGATLVTAGGSHTTDISYVFDAREFDDDFKGADITLELSAYAIQDRLPAHNVYTTSPLYATYLLVNEYSLPLTYFDLTLPAETGFELLDTDSQVISDTEMLQGSNFTFKLNRATNYETARVVVKNNGEELKATGTDTYTIYNVQDDINITIEPYANVIDYSTLTTANLTSSDYYSHYDEDLGVYIVDYLYNLKFTDIAADNSPIYLNFDNVYNLNMLGILLNGLSYSVASADADNTYDWSYPLIDNLPHALTAGEYLASAIIREAYLTEEEMNASISSAPRLQIGKNPFAVNTTKVDYSTLEETYTEMSESVFMFDQGGAYYVYNFDIDNMESGAQVNVAFNTTFTQSMAMAIPGNWQVVDMMMGNIGSDIEAQMVELSVGTSSAVTPDSDGKVCIFVVGIMSSESDIPLFINPDISVTLDKVTEYTHTIDFATLTTYTANTDTIKIIGTEYGITAYQYDIEIVNVTTTGYIKLDGTFLQIEVDGLALMPGGSDNTLRLDAGQDFKFSLMSWMAPSEGLNATPLNIIKLTSTPSKFRYKDFNYTKVDGGYQVSLTTDSLLGPDNHYTDVVIPNSINDLPIVSIGGSLYEESATNITSITIPANVTSFSWSSFEKCPALTTMNFAVSTGWQVSTDGGATWTDTTTDDIHSELKQNTNPNYQWRRV